MLYVDVTFTCTAKLPLSYLTSYLCYYCAKPSTKLVKTQWHNKESTLLTSATLPLFQSFQASGGCGGTGPIPDLTKHPTAHIGSKAQSSLVARKGTITMALMPWLISINTVTMNLRQEGCGWVLVLLPLATVNNGVDFKCSKWGQKAVTWT